VRHRLPADSVLRFAGGGRSLVRVRGVASGDAASPAPPGGEFAPFAHHEPSSRFLLEVTGIETSEGFFPSSGRLAVSLREEGREACAGRPVHAGDTVEALGWLGMPEAPKNPGEFDWAEHDRRQGVAAHFRATDVRQVGISRSPGSCLAIARARAATAAEDSLHAGLRPGPAATLASALLLGARDGEGAAELWQDFQRAGLAHVLAISGANVGIFLLGVWILGRLLSGRPGRAACAVLAVIGLFLLAVPDDTPVLRAGLMAALLAGAYGLGRPVPGLWALGVAAFILLLLRPEELFSPGFQLSFAAVGALLLFTGPISDRVEPWITGRLPIENAAHLPAWRLALRRAVRLGVEAAVAGFVVFLAVLPILACHYDAVNPLAALFSLAAAPVAALLMWVGYAKIALGLLFAPLGAVLAWPVEGLAGLLAWVVHAAAKVPGAQVALVKPAAPGVAVAAAGAVWWALWMWAKPAAPAHLGAEEDGKRGFWPRMAAPSLAAGALLVAGAFAVLFAEQGLAWKSLRDRPGLRLHELAVGDGSCILLETRDHAVLFDCGSRTLARPGHGRPRFAPPGRALA
jgi:competence protein ComEC